MYWIAKDSCCCHILVGGTTVWFFSLAQWTWMRKLLSTAVEQRGEKWNSAPSFPLYGYSDQRELENKGLRTLIFNCSLPKSQWFYTEWFMSLTPMTHIAVQLSEKALTLKSNCFKTHAHYVKRVNIYSIIAGSFNTRILYWVKIEQNILIDDETLGYFQHPKRWFSDNGQYRKKLGLSKKSVW